MKPKNSTEGLKNLFYTCTGYLHHLRYLLLIEPLQQTVQVFYRVMQIKIDGRELRLILAQKLIPNWEYLNYFIAVNKSLPEVKRYRLEVAYGLLALNDYCDYEDSPNTRAAQKALQEIKTKARFRIWRPILASFQDKLDTGSPWQYPGYQIAQSLALRATLSKQSYELLTQNWDALIGKLHPEDSDAAFLLVQTLDDRFKSGRDTEIVNSVSKLTQNLREKMQEKYNK